MSVPDDMRQQSASTERSSLPEQDLLRDPDRFRDIVGAFLRGEITADEYSEMTMAEIGRRDSAGLVEDVAPAPAPGAPVLTGRIRADERRSEPRRSPTVLASDFVSGALSAPQFLRLIRSGAARPGPGSS